MTVVEGHRASCPELEQAIFRLRASSPDCLAIGIVRVDDGAPFAVSAADPAGSEAFERVRLGLGEIFDDLRGAAMLSSGDHPDDDHPDDDQPEGIDEIVLSTTDLVHVLRRAHRCEVVMVTIMRRPPLLGRVLAEVRAWMSELERAYPCPESDGS